ncbi:hypothetical protein [Corynebacterium halotolerans]|uniref:Uncharacterized protein n=1 Tax=Corynebacterium halotolerans YIM 70093 = DSM 44683 TaxID=1121362 RepID=M1NIL8_9CORY|nr:hypothetical protein [Corynebacterium halotolerans]AGF71273.1 hypothetical protein A605_01295 [Corynebacterium halotolerans YIM 70093 = DSM 44683]
MGSNTSETDFHPDDLLAGRLIQAAVTGASVAMPDYISSRAVRAAVTTVIGVGGGVLIGYLNTRDEDPDNDPAVVADRMRQSIGDIGSPGGPGSDTPAGALNLDSPVRTWLILAAAVALIVLSLRLDAVVRRWLVRKLRDRGVRRPHTVLGAVASAVVFLISEASHRSHVRQVIA